MYSKNVLFKHSVKCFNRTIDRVFTSANNSIRCLSISYVLSDIIWLFFWKHYSMSPTIRLSLFVFLIIFKGRHTRLKSIDYVINCLSRTFQSTRNLFNWKILVIIWVYERKFIRVKVCIGHSVLTPYVFFGRKYILSLAQKAYLPFSSRRFK